MTPEQEAARDADREERIRATQWAEHERQHAADPRDTADSYALIAKALDYYAARPEDAL